MQHVGIIRASCLPGVNHYTFQCPGVGAEKIAGLWFAGGESVPRIDSMIYKKWVYLSLRPVSQINNISIGLSANKMELQSKQIKDNFKRRIFIFLSKTPKLFEMYWLGVLTEMKCKIILCINTLSQYNEWYVHFLVPFFHQKILLFHLYIESQLVKHLVLMWWLAITSVSEMRKKVLFNKFCTSDICTFSSSWYNSWC